MTSPIEDELRELLHERADGLGSTPDPWARAVGAIEVNRRHRRRIAGGIAAVVLALVVGVGAALTTGPLARDRATMPAHEPTSPPVGGQPVPGSAPRVHRAGGSPLMARVPQGLELVALTRAGLDVPFELARINPASGRITTSQVPPLLTADGEGVWLVTGPGYALVHPGDASPGYLIPRHGHAWKLTSGPLASAGPAFPGPRSGQVWLHDPNEPQRWQLVGLDGRPIGPVIDLEPGQGVGHVDSDGSGYLMVLPDEAVYGGASPADQSVSDARPSGQRRVARGSLISAGSSGLLMRPCAREERCRLVMVHPGNDRKQRVPSPCPAQQRPLPWPSSGTISPDGRTAAMFCVGNTLDPELYLLDLSTGQAHPVEADLQGSDAGLVWSPNSQWLFNLDDAGHLVAIDRDNGQAQQLDTGLPPLAQLAGG